MTVEDKKLLDYAEHITDHLIHGTHILDSIDPLADEPAISSIATDIYNAMDNDINMLIKTGLMLKQSVDHNKYNYSEERINVIRAVISQIEKIVDAFNNYVKNY